MKIIITGTTSGIGQGIHNILSQSHDIIALTREAYNMDTENVFETTSFGPVDMLINCAGHDLGGKVDFINHNSEHWIKILNTNLINAMALTHKVLQDNSNAVIVNIASTNVDQYYPNDLVYSLTKTALSTFTKYLRIEYPHNKANYKEVRLGLTKTNFVKNRYKENHAEIIDLYELYDFLTVEESSTRVANFVFTNDNFIRIVKE
jgi:short-subunit dehydrogenase